MHLQALGWVVYAFRGPWESCYSAAEEFTTEFNFLLSSKMHPLCYLLQLSQTEELAVLMWHAI